MMQPLAQALNRWQLPLTLLALAAAFLPGLGRAGLLDPWEMDRAAVARTMAASPRVVVVDGDGAALLKSLEHDAPGRFGLVRAGDKPDVSAATALQQAVTQLNRRLAHAVVIDADAVLAKADRGRIDSLAGPLEQIANQNLGTAVLLVTSGDPTSLRHELAAARGRIVQKSLAGGTFAGLFGDDAASAALAQLLAGPEWLTSRAQLATVLQQRCPSPWRMPLHKKDNQSVAAPWLDAALTGASLRALGPTEFAARFPGALLAILTGLLVVMATARLWSPVEGWLALLVYTTLPMTWGMAHTVTFEATPALGIALVTLGLALGSANRARSWWIWFGLGLGVLLLGRGLAGLTMAAGISMAYVLATGDLRKRSILPAIFSVLGLGIAALVVLGNESSPLLRSMRFTQWPFGGGPDNFHRDFSWFIGQAGFGLFPWGAPFVLGLARLFGSAEPDDDAQADAPRRARIILLLGCAVPLLVVAILIRQFNHFVVPFAPIVAVVTAALLADVRLGRLEGRLVAFFVLLATLMLHREIGKGADALTRFVAFDPPLAPETGTYPWPGELVMPKALSALALVCVAGFALGLARPLATLREQILRLRGSRAAAWALGITGIVWALDALVSLGTKLDVLLKTNSMTTGYAYDRMWVTYQGTRPEVLAGAATFAILLTAAAVASLLDPEAIRRRTLLHIPMQVSALLRPPVVALALCGAATAGVLLSGLSIHDHVTHHGWGAALAAGLHAAAFLGPLKLAVLAALGTWLVRRAAPGSLFDSERNGSLVSPLRQGLGASGGFISALLGLCAIAGIGIGASQAAGTWTYTFLASCWLLGLLVAHTVIGRAQDDASKYGWPLAAAGSVIASSVFVPLAARYIGEIPVRGEAIRYVVHVLVTAPDSGGMLWIALFFALNRLAASRASVERTLSWGLGLLGRLEQPRPAVALLACAGILFSAGFAFSLLPGLSVHYSQKHLLVRISEVGGSGRDAGGAPRTFSHGSTKSGSDNNFYTQSMPSIEDRQAALALLADQETQARITDNSEGGTTRTVNLTGHPQRFLVVPKDAFSELNHEYRLAHDGQHIAVLDARSSRLVLAASKLLPGQQDENWLRKSVLTQAQFDAEKGVTRIAANFDNSLMLIGFKLADNAVARSQKYKLTLYWKVQKATTTSWKLFMHPHPLHLDRWPLSPPDPSEDENKPCIGCFQTNHWLAGDIIADSFEQEVPLGTQSGPNEIILGWYNPSNDQRMPLLSAAGEGVIKQGDNRVTIGNLQVR